MESHFTRPPTCPLWPGARTWPQSYRRQRRTHTNQLTLAGCKSWLFGLAIPLLFAFGPAAMASPYTLLNGAQPRPFYACAHNPNEVQQAEDALKNGCNALEPDITEITCNGQEVLIDWDSDLGIVLCGDGPNLADWCDGVNGLAQKYTNLALVVFDIKDWAASPGDPAQVQKNAADILDAARNHLNANGVELNVIYSVGSFDDAGILLEMLKLGLGPREGIQIDAEDTPGKVVQYFFDHGYSGNIGYGDGTAAQGPNLPRIMDRAAYLRASTGYPKAVSYVYTLSQEPSMNFFIDAGVDGIICTDATQQQLTNVVAQFHSEVRLATRQDNPFLPLNEAYGVQVHTDNQGDSGTDSLLVITLNGCQGSSLIYYYSDNIYPGYDTARLRDGNDDWMTIPSLDLGQLQSITIENLGPDVPFAGWDLTEVHVSSARYIGPNFFLNGAPTREYSATYNQTIKFGDKVTIPLTPNFSLPLPTIQCPGPISVSGDANQCGAVVTFTPTVNGLCNDVSAVCTPPSGSLFAVGQTTVSCFAQSASAQSQPCSFLVTVTDNQPPTLTCPAPMVVNATGPSGAVVTFAPTASDNCGSVTVVSTPASGQVFPVGDTVVQCTATDKALNQVSCTFNVHVKSAAEQLSDLLTKLKGMKVSSSGVKKALVSDLTLALTSLQNKDTLPACGSLHAFIDLVKAQSGVSISTSDANYLITEATRILAAMGC